MAENPSSVRVALITGANKGIGFEIARQLGRHGITVLVGARDSQRGKQATEALVGEGIDARDIQLDVTSQSSIDAAAEEVGAKFGRLDILVNNAGILVERVLPSECAVQNLRKTFETNFFGLFAVTKAFLPLIRKSTAGRIVNLSSALGSLTLLTNPERFENKFLAYSASKVALNTLTVTLARELSNTPIKVNSVAPGYVATDMNNHMGILTVEQGAATPVRMALLSHDGPSGLFVEADNVVAW
jgi:NAD(P)-dependent dehydrogenase (short-subunit alcohol dehydrogenase family)